MSLTLALRRLFRWLVRSPDANELVTDASRYHRLKWQVALSITFGYGAYYVCRLSLNVVKKPLIDAGLFNAAELGLIGSALFFSYAAGKFLNGMLADHAHVKRFMSLGLLVSGLLNLALGDIRQFWLFFVLWGLNGWFQSIGAPASVVSIAQWYPARGRGTVYGIWSTSHNIGEACTYVFTAVVVAAWGWAWGLRAAGLFGVLSAAAIYFFLHERPAVQGLLVEESGPQPQATPVDARTLRHQQWEVLTNGWVWVLALASAFFYVTRYAITSWGVFFLQESKGYGTVEAGSIVAVNAVAGIAGTFFSGIVSDRWFGGSRNAPALGACMLYALSTALFVYGPGIPALDLAAMALFGVAMGALLVYLGGLMAVDICSKSTAGTAMGVVGVASYLGAALQEILSGHLIEASKQVIAGKAHYNFGLASKLWIGAALLSMVLTLVVTLRGRGGAGSGK